MQCSAMAESVLLMTKMSGHTHTHTDTQEVLDDVAADDATRTWKVS